MKGCEEPNERTLRRLSLHPPSEVNPYTTHIHEHPSVLLAIPSPGRLREMMAAGIAGGLDLAVELGCGSGNFLVEMAARHPSMAFAGFELRYKRLVKAARKIERRGLKNAWLVRDLAERFPLYFEPESLSRVYLNFPDPWPKPSQWKHRLLNADFFTVLGRVLRPDGRFCFKTDHSGYLLHVLSILSHAPGWRIRAFHNDIQRSRLANLSVRSEFENLFRAMGKPVFYLELDKAGATG
ncbi:MAG: tRNA (guanosine(46)-N7)-methyltransferase TrmB [SAR324 cluster bacterium]|nr:tRNA (guanosine(46)-N7)-methyltransferase TrmB [SAR324 cluster bacterium]